MQLFYYQDPSSDTALPTVAAVDLGKRFPEYYNSLSVELAALDPVRPGHVAVFDRGQPAVIVVDTEKSQSVVINLDDHLDGIGSHYRRGGGSSFRSMFDGSSAGGQHGGAIKGSDTIGFHSTLASGGELILTQKDEAKIVVVDLLAHFVASIQLPIEGVIEDLLIADRDNWLVTMTTSDDDAAGNTAATRAYVLSRAKSGDPIPTELSTIEIKPGDEGWAGAREPPRWIERQRSEVGSGGAKARRHFLSRASEYLGQTDLLPVKLQDATPIEVHGWYRPPGFGKKQQPGAITGCLANGAGVVATIMNHAPVDTTSAGNDDLDDSQRSSVHLELVDFDRATRRVVDVPVSMVEELGRRWDGSTLYSPAEVVKVLEHPDGIVATADAAGVIRAWEVSVEGLEASLRAWKKMIGADNTAGKFELTYSNVDGRKELARYSGLGNEAPKHGKEDPENAPHVGGNTWAGGTGGRDTAGLGGKGGPYRLDKGHDVHQLSDTEKDTVPEHIKEAARKVGQEAYRRRLKEIEMSEHDAQMYGSFVATVEKEIRELRLIASGLEAKAEERVWLRHQTDGEMDDDKIIEGLTGEHTIYKRRGLQDPTAGGQQEHPKRVCFVADVSGASPARPAGCADRSSVPHITLRLRTRNPCPAVRLRTLRLCVHVRR